MMTMSAAIAATSSPYSTALAPSSLASGDEALDECGACRFCHRCADDERGAR